MVGVIGVVVAGVVKVVVVALVVSAASGAVFVGAGVVAKVTSGSYVLPLPLVCSLDLASCLHVLPYTGTKGLPPPIKKDAGMTSP